MKLPSEKMAFDRAAISVRSTDVDGRLHVETTPISKANVCPYMGSEIPGSDVLGLDANKIYYLYRDPDEIAKAAGTFNRLPILNKHIPVSAIDPQKDSIVGSTGTDAAFSPPYLTNSMVIWDAAAIALIESGEQKELSSAYRYTPDMTSGEVNGERYDGVMRNLIANHLAVVPKGRAGPDVVVGDQHNPLTIKGTPPMAKKILPPSAVRAKNALVKTLRGKIAQDAELGDIVELLDALESDPAVTETVPDVTGEATPTDKIRAIAGDRLSDEEIAALVALMTPPAAASPVFVDEKDDKDGENKDEKDDDKVSKTAMDSAIAAAVTAAEANTVARFKKLQAAQQHVEPWVGKLLGMDSADAVYQHALKTLGVDVTGVHASAYPAILKAQPLPGSRSVTRIAADSARVSGASGFATRFPGAAPIRRI